MVHLLCATIGCRACLSGRRSLSILENRQQVPTCSSYSDKLRELPQGPRVIPPLQPRRLSSRLPGTGTSSLRPSTGLAWPSLGVCTQEDAHTGRGLQQRPEALADTVHLPEGSLTSEEPNTWWFSLSAVYFVFSIVSGVHIVIL